MKPEDKKKLKLAAVDIRKGIMESTHAAKSGHPGGSLSAADVIAYLYFHEMRIRPEEPDWEDRDRFVLSKGHAAPAVYAALALKGFFPMEDLQTLRHIGSHLQGHPNMNLTKGIDMSTGSLGQGLSCAAGMAKGAKLRKKDINVYALCGDGEMDEGIIWEAVMFSAHYKLDNLCIMVDVNGLQIDGRTSDVMNTDPLDRKFEAFGCHVYHVEGHDFESLDGGFRHFHENHGSGKPTVLLMDTEKGKGIAYMESEAGWHGKAPNDMQYKLAMAELEAHRMALEVL
ncbi:MAG: transketolase [Solobacterium sp.]|nr:transketolase [Solobacterium sp.]